MALVAVRRRSPRSGAASLRLLREDRAALEAEPRGDGR